MVVESVGQKVLKSPKWDWKMSPVLLQRAGGSGCGIGVSNLYIAVLSEVSTFSDFIFNCIISILFSCFFQSHFSLKLQQFFMLF